MIFVKFTFSLQTQFAFTHKWLVHDSPHSQCSIQDIVNHLSGIVGHSRLHPDECLRTDNHSDFSICEYYNVEKYQCETLPIPSWIIFGLILPIIFLLFIWVLLVIILSWDWKNRRLFYKHITEHCVVILPHHIRVGFSSSNDVMNSSSNVGSNPNVPNFEHVELWKIKLGISWTS